MSRAALRLVPPPPRLPGYAERYRRRARWLAAGFVCLGVALWVVTGWLLARLTGCAP